MVWKLAIFQKIFANSDNSDLLGNSFYFKGKANLWMKMMEVVSYFRSINAPCVGDNKKKTERWYHFFVMQKSFINFLKFIYFKISMFLHTDSNLI